MKADPTTYRHTNAGRELFVSLLPSIIRRQGEENAWDMYNCPGHVRQLVSICSKLCALSRTNKRNAERACSDSACSEEDKARDRRNVQRILETVELLGPGWGVKFSYDPRGATVKIKTPDGRTDDWGGEGICVPGS